jgi:hypothetical protein
VKITIFPEASDAAIIYDGKILDGNTITLDVRHADIYTTQYTIRAANGYEQKYSFLLERRYRYEEIVSQTFSNILQINNNPANNGGHKFTNYMWYKNGEPVDTGQYYVIGERGVEIDNTIQYSAEMLTTDGKLLHICQSKTAKSQAKSASVVKAYPNPVIGNGKVTLVCPADFFERQPTKNVKVLSSTGSIVSMQTIDADNTEVQMPALSGSYMIIIENADVVKVAIK